MSSGRATRDTTRGPLLFHAPLAPRFGAPQCASLAPNRGLGYEVPCAPERGQLCLRRAKCLGFSCVIARLSRAAGAGGRAGAACILHNLVNVNFLRRC